MNPDEIIARAAPPPERTGGPFAPVPTDPETLRRRQDRMAEACGSRDAAAAHAEKLGVDLDVWLGRLRDVRLDGDDPPWAAIFRELLPRLGEGRDPLADVGNWARDRLEAAWPAVLPRGPDAPDGLVGYFRWRISMPFLFLADAERRLDLAPSWGERFVRHPVLAWIFGQVAVDWLDDATTMIGRAAADRPLYSRALMGVEDPGRLLKVEPGLGDPHRGGRSVAILRFERGSVVYKPKDLRIASQVGEIAAHIGEPGVAGPAILLRDGYAWETEYQVRPVSGPQGGDAFYRALGGWLALLQGLGAVDFWFDNLIADGPVPRFIDFETAIQPLGKSLAPDGAVTQVLRADPGAVGILPTFSLVGYGREPTDLGCLAWPGEHQVPAYVTGHPQSWEESDYAPRLSNGKTLDVSDHFEAFEDGYLRVARALRDTGLQSRIMESLRRSPDAVIRVILVDTWTCYHILRRSVAFGNLSDGVWREVALHAELTRFASINGPLREDVVTELRRLDVPLFQTRLNSRDLFGVGRGRRRDYFPLDALSEVQQRIRALAAEPEELLLARLRSGFSLRGNNPPRRQPAKGTIRPAGAADLLEWAHEIATDIERYAMSDDRGKPTWVGACIDAFSGWRAIAPLRLDVLCGRTGIAFALLHLAASLQRPGMAALACEALEGVALDYLRAPEFLDNSGYIVGVGGVVAALAGAPGLRPMAEKVYRTAGEREIWMSSGADFVSGLEGWRRAAEAVGETAPLQHGPGRAYTPKVLPRLAPWLDPPSAAPLCPDRHSAARLRLNRDLHGAWFSHLWMEDRHNLSGVDGLPALAISFVRLAANGAVTDPVPHHLR